VTPQSTGRSSALAAAKGTHHVQKTLLTVVQSNLRPVTMDLNEYSPNSTWLDSTRLDTFDFVEPVDQVETSVSSETSRAVPTWRTTNKLLLLQIRHQLNT